MIHLYIISSIILIIQYGLFLFRISNIDDDIKFKSQKDAQKWLIPFYPLIILIKLFLRNYNNLE